MLPDHEMLLIISNLAARDLWKDLDVLDYI